MQITATLRQGQNGVIRDAGQMVFTLTPNSSD